MIYINFKNGQGLGNQLWLYIVGISVAKKIKTNLKILNYKNFVGKYFLKLKYTKSNFIKIKHIFYEKFYYDKEIKYISHFFDEKILNIKKNTLLEGYFQDERYFFKKKINLKKYIIFKKIDSFNSLSLDKKTCVINIRGGEYKRHKEFILPKKYWIDSINLMKKNGIKNFIIVTDDKKYCEKFLPGYPIISNSIEKSFLYLYKAKNLIVSNSTFSYFPISMQDKKPFVLAPAYWGRHTSLKKRWAAISNFYSNWNWISPDGKILNKGNILKSIKKTELTYKNNYNLLSEFKDFDHLGIRKYIPKLLRNLIKKILSLFLPLRFG
jgi:hypothetical protein